MNSEVQVPQKLHLCLGALNQLSAVIINTSRFISKNILSEQSVEECLESLDLFKEIMEDKIQRKKVIKDVMRSLKLHQYAAETILYTKGDVPQKIYLLIQGKVSLFRPVFKKEGEQQFQYQQINTFQKNQGFGQGQFIQNKRRALTAIVKENSAIIGTIQATSFQQIIDHYRKRVYNQKLDMFMKCPLLKNLQSNQIQFIVNNTKPMSFGISKKIVSQGERAKSLYLITKGQVELFHVEKCSSSRGINKQEEDVVKVGIVEVGSFIGDFQLALSEMYDYTATCKTEKVQAYVCDERIVMSQMNSTLLQDAQSFYSSKRQYYFIKRNKHFIVRTKIQEKCSNDMKIVLNPQQIEIRRRIRTRYMEKTPTLIGQCSPKQIELMIDRKLARVKTEPKKQVLPQILSSRQKKAFTKTRKTEVVGINKINSGHSQDKKKITIDFSNDKDKNNQNQTIKSLKPSPSMHIDYLERRENNYYDFHLGNIRPFYNKLTSLHQRLAKQMRQQKIKEEKWLTENIKLKFNSKTKKKQIMKTIIGVSIVKDQ